MNWKLIDELHNDEKIHYGALIRFYNKDKAVTKCSNLPIEPCDYIISPIYANDDYFQLICLSQGEEGSIGGILKRQEYYVTGAEIKKMLVSDLYKILININPHISID